MDELIRRLADAGRVTGDMVVLEFYESGEIFKAVDLFTFRGFFESALDSAYPGAEYKALMAADDNSDCTSKGYESYFREWHAAGLI